MVTDLYIAYGVIPVQGMYEGGKCVYVHYCHKVKWQDHETRDSEDSTDVRKYVYIRNVVSTGISKDTALTVSKCILVPPLSHTDFYARKTDLTSCTVFCSKHCRAEPQIYVYSQ